MAGASNYIVQLDAQNVIVGIDKLMSVNSVERLVEAFLKGRQPQSSRLCRRMLAILEQLPDL
jgi:hypothetical protein